MARLQFLPHFHQSTDEEPDGIAALPSTDEGLLNSATEQTEIAEDGSNTEPDAAAQLHSRASLDLLGGPM